MQPSLEGVEAEQFPVTIMLYCDTTGGDGLPVLELLLEAADIIVARYRSLLGSEGALTDFRRR